MQVVKVVVALLNKFVFVVEDGHRDLIADPSARPATLLFPVDEPDLCTPHTQNLSAADRGSRRGQRRDRRPTPGPVGEPTCTISYQGALAT
jgi:hypothetical protein